MFVKNKLTLLSYANVIRDTGSYKLDGADDIPFDGLLTEIERRKNDKNGKTHWYWLDTPYVDSSTDFMGVGIDGWPYDYGSAMNTSAVVPCFALSRRR